MDLERFSKTDRVVDQDVVDLWLGRRHYQQHDPLHPGISCVEGVEGTTLEVGLMYPPPKLPVKFHEGCFMKTMTFLIVDLSPLTTLQSDPMKLIARFDVLRIHLTVLFIKEVLFTQRIQLQTYIKGRKYKKKFVFILSFTLSNECKHP